MHVCTANKRLYGKFRKRLYGKSGLRSCLQDHSLDPHNHSQHLCITRSALRMTASTYISLAVPSEALSYHSLGPQIHCACANSLLRTCVLPIHLSVHQIVCCLMLNASTHHRTLRSCYQYTCQCPQKHCHITRWALRFTARVLIHF